MFGHRFHVGTMFFLAKSEEHPICSTENLINARFFYKELVWEYFNMYM